MNAAVAAAAILMCTSGNDLRYYVSELSEKSAMTVLDQGGVIEKGVSQIERIGDERRFFLQVPSRSEVTIYASIDGKNHGTIHISRNGQPAFSGALSCK